MRTMRLISIGLLLPLGVAIAPGGDVPGIENFQRIDECVATGAQPTLSQLAALRDLGFRTVINLREPSEHDAEAEARAVRRLGLLYFSIPVRTADPKEEQAEEFLRITSDPQIFPVFLHCGSGNRAGAFWMIRRIIVDGWSPADAEQEARRIGLRSANLRQFALDYARKREEPLGWRVCSGNGRPGASLTRGERQTSSR